MNIKNRIIGLLLVLITIFTMISPLTPAYAVGGGDGLGNTTSTGGSSSGTWSSSRTGIRVYVVDKNGNLVSNIVDVISNTAIPNYRIIACLGTRGNGTYQSFAAGGLYANGVFYSSTNSGAKVTIISDTTAGLRGKGMPIQTYTSSKFSTHGETLRKTMLGSSGNTWIDDTEVMGGGGGASSTEGAKEFGEFISELNTALIDTFNKQKELGIYSNAELVAYIDKQIISITNQINGVDSETGEALFTDEEKQVIAATLQKFKETALSELNTGTENSSEESLSVDVTNQLFDIAYASETSGNSLHQLYDDGELIRFMDKFIGSIPLFYFNEASGVTQLSVYSETGQESFLLTCAEKGFIIFMEPLFYSRLNKANKAASEYLFYGTIKALMKSNVPANIITAITVTGDTLTKYFSGEISTQECMIELGSKGLNMATAGYSMLVGQALIPIPIIGGAIGAFVGSLMTGKLYEDFINQLQIKELEHQERMRIIEECNRAAEQARIYRIQLENYLQNYFNEYQTCFDESLSCIRFSFQAGDADGIIAGANRITRKLGGQVKYENMEEFEVFLKDDSPDIL